MRVLILLMLNMLNLILNGCRSTNSKHALIDGVSVSVDQRKVLEKEVEVNKSPDAASRLAQHYLLVEEDYELASYWFRKAAQYGGVTEKEVYQSYLESMKEFDESDD
jgi:hypothetical protein